MKRVTFVVAGFVAVVIVLLFTKPDDLNKVKVKKENLVAHSAEVMKTFE